MFNRRKSTKQQIWTALIILTVVGCVTLIYASLKYGGQHFSKKWKKGESTVQEKLTDEKCISVCSSEECVQQSKMLLNHVNPSVDPCENFYEFACGKYLEKFATNESNTFESRMKEQMELKIKDILERIEPEVDTISGKLRIIYDSCIKRSSSDMKAVSTVLQRLSQLGIPDWPHLGSDFKFEDPSFQSVLANFIAHKEYAFFDIDEEFIYREKLYEEANASIEFRKGSYESTKASDRKYLVEKILQYLNVDNENIIRIWNDSEVILNAIVKLKEESDENNGFETNLLDCKLEEERQWKPVCEVLKSFVDVADVDRYISNRFVYLRDSNIYLAENIFSVLNNFSDRSIANFLSLNLLLNHLDDLNFYFRRLFGKNPDLILQHTGTYANMGHWRHCTEWLMKKLFIPLGYEYMKSVLTKSVVEELDGLVREIILETAGEISHQTWITEVMKNKMTIRVEYQRFSVSQLKNVLTNDTLINDLYKELHPNEENFMFNIFEYQRFSKLLDMQGVLHPKFYNLAWIDSSLLAAQAASGGGKVDVNFGILMPPVYYPNLERIINTVTLSTIIAHEIGHVLQEFNYRLQREDKGAKNFTDEVQTCISNQYSKFRFTLAGKYMKGANYSRENFADLIAISIIDKFIEKYSIHEEAFLLPSFSYFTQQMLYISSMQMYCTASSQKDEIFNDKFSSHTLPKFRMLGMLQNSKGFAKAFNCPDGSYMNPATKCAYFLDKMGKI